MVYRPAQVYNGSGWDDIGDKRIGAESGDIPQASVTDLTSDLAQKLPYSYGTATPSTTDSGFLWYDSNSTPAAPKFWDGSAFQALTSGKILQVVRATDTSVRSTTSTSFTDFGLSVTITPQSNTNAILLIFSGGFARSFATSGNFGGDVIITDSSNNAISGAQRSGFGYLSNFSYSGTGEVAFHSIVIAYATPATTSATTYKVRYKSASASATFQFLNDQQTAQLFALEVSA